MSEKFSIENLSIDSLSSDERHRMRMADQKKMAHSVKLEPNEDYAAAALLCPLCESEHVHNEKIDTFGRREDEEEGTHAAVNAYGRSVSVDRDMSGNPSARRQGVVLSFSCEGCGGHFALGISQHKGNTFFNAWELDAPNLYEDERAEEAAEHAPVELDD